MAGKRTVTMPPYGVKYKAWAAKKASGHAPKWNGAGWGSVSCGKCERRLSPSGEQAQDKSIRVPLGGKRLTKCPSCSASIPKDGFVDSRTT